MNILKTTSDYWSFIVGVTLGKKLFLNLYMCGEMVVAPSVNLCVDDIVMRIEEYHHFEQTKI